MSLETGLASLKLAFSKPGPLEVSFFGGEPMIAFEQMARLTRAASGWARRTGRSLRFAVTTNATILKEKHLHFLRHYGFFVGLSVDGLEEDHDRHRPFVGGRGSGQLVWRNLEAACHQLPDFRVLTVVRPDTLAGLPRAVERMYRMGVSKISLLPDMEADWSASHQLLRQVYGQLAQVSYLSTLTEEPLWISPFTELQSCLVTHLEASVGAPRGCGFGSDELAVSPAGNFYPCARLVGPDRRAEVRIGSLESGLDLERIQSLQHKAQEGLQQCGSGGCQCLALMPGDVGFQLQNVAMFTHLAGEVCREAREALEGVAA